MQALLFVLVLGFFAWMTALGLRRAAKGDDLSILPQIENEFRQLIVAGASPELCFDGRTAEIVTIVMRVLTARRPAPLPYIAFIGLLGTLLANTFLSSPTVPANRSSSTLASRMRRLLLDGNI